MISDNWKYYCLGKHLPDNMVVSSDVILSYIRDFTAVLIILFRKVDTKNLRFTYGTNGYKKCFK